MKSRLCYLQRSVFECLYLINKEMGVVTLNIIRTRGHGHCNLTNQSAAFKRDEAYGKVEKVEGWAQVPKYLLRFMPNMQYSMLNLKYLPICR